jgi:hypothetical protein
MVHTKGGQHYEEIKDLGWKHPSQYFDARICAYKLVKGKDAELPAAIVAKVKPATSTNFPDSASAAKLAHVHMQKRQAAEAAEREQVHLVPC